MWEKNYEVNAHPVNAVMEFICTKLFQWLYAFKKIKKHIYYEMLMCIFFSKIWWIKEIWNIFTYRCIVFSDFCII